MFNVFGIAGLGLMGGSLAKVLGRSFKGAQILAMDVSVPTLEEAGDCGVISEGFTPERTAEMLGRCDIVFVCLYPRSSLMFLRKHREDFKPGSIVTDISGVKGEIAGLIPEIIRPDIDFICGHPMAGSEKEGFLHSDAGIFAGKNYILMPLPSNKEENLVFFKELIRKIGFSHITETDFASHDHKIAFTSQLCHIIACALVDSAEDTGITAFGGGSYEDLTRIAMINAPLWTELFLSNKTELLHHLEAFEISLKKLKALIESDNSHALSDELKNVRRKRIAMLRSDAQAGELL